MWTDKLKIGDLVWSRQDNKPALILDTAETARAKYGDLVNKRMEFNLEPCINFLDIYLTASTLTKPLYSAMLYI